jgi:dTDP-glucose pyrophosphorylase
MFLKIISRDVTHLFEAQHISYSKQELVACQLADDNYIKYNSLGFFKKIEQDQDVKVFLFELSNPEGHYVVPVDRISAVYIMNENGKTIDTPRF